VALLLSDQHLAMGARFLKGGGPHLDLLRRLSHWLMGSPILKKRHCGSK